MSALPLAELEKKLTTNTFVNGHQPTACDAINFEALGTNIPDKEQYPHVWVWYSLMVLFEDQVINSWKSCQGGNKHPQESKKEHKTSCDKKDKKCSNQVNEECPKNKKKKEENKPKEEPKNEDEDFDPFAEDTPEEKAQKEKKKTEEKTKDKTNDTNKKKKKKKEIEKSIVVLEVKGWEAEQDLMALAKKIISNIQKDGLQWNKGYKTEEVAFGIKKLIMGFICEDEKVSVQEIIDEIEAMEDEVQGVETVSFNKC